MEGDAQHVGVFDAEQAVLVQLVGLAAQGAAHHLFAQELGAEGAHAQNVGDGVGVPAFGEHGNGHHAADGTAQGALLADGVHHFAQQVLVGDFLAAGQVAGAFHTLAAEALDLVRRHGTELGVQGFAGFQPLAVDQQGVGAGERLALFVEVAEQRQAALFQPGRTRLAILAALPGHQEPRDVVVEQLGGRLVVAHHDEARRHAHAGVSPCLEGLLVMAVERFQGGLQLGRKRQRVQAALSGASARHALADMRPEFAELRHLAARHVVRHRHPGQLDDAALDGVHQREIRHRPRKERALGVAGAAQEERRGGEVDHAGDAELGLENLQAADPHPRRLLVLLRFATFLALERSFLAQLLGLGGVAVVAFVVEHQHVLHAHQLPAHALQHLAFGLQRGRLLPRPLALQQPARAFGHLHPLAAHEGVEVGDEDLGAAEVRQHVRGDEFAAGIVALRVVRQQHAQAVADGDAGRRHQKAAGEARAVRAAHCVHRLPGDEHGHHGGLAGSGGELQRKAVEAGIRPVVGGLQVIEEAPCLAAELRRHFHQPDRGLGGFHLAEERPDAGERVVPPVLKQPRRLRRHLPLAFRQFPPRGDLLAHAVDDVRVLVLLVGGVYFGRGLVEGELALATPQAPRLGDGRDEGRLAPVLDDAVGRPPLVELPMPPRTLVGRVENRLFEEAGQCVGRCLETAL